MSSERPLTSRDLFEQEMRRRGISIHFYRYARADGEEVYEWLSLQRHWETWQAAWAESAAAFSGLGK